jgi:tetratricopeptide (TPR) repeat protein
MYQARAYARVPDFENAGRLFNQALAAAQALRDTSAIAQVRLQTGWFHYNHRDLTSALLHFNAALETGEILNDKSVQADAWFGIGLAYYSFDDMDSMQPAIENYLAMADPLTQQSRIADAHRLLGAFHRSKGRFQEAIDANQRSYDVAASISDSLQMGAALNHIAWYYYEMGNLDKSLEIYRKNIGFYHSGGGNPLANIYGNMGNIYRDWERYPEAIEYYDKSIELALTNNDLYNLSWLYEDISNMYQRIGDYRQAYENMKLALQYQDSLASVTYQQSMAGARAQYEAEKNARELELLSLKLQRNRFVNWTLGIGIALIITIAALIITRSRLKSRQRIEAMNRRISELNQTNLRQQMNPHFIFNTLNSIQYYVFQNDKISSNNYMTKFAALIRKTLENSRHTTITIKEELDTLNLYLELESLRFKEKFDWDIRVDEEIDSLAYKIPTMLIQPYVENAITHGLMNKENGKGNIRIELELSADQILCTIEDNGIGRARAQEIKLQKNNQHQSMGTTITESRLKLVNELYGKNMKVHYTDLADAAGNPAGTRVQVNFPIIT